MIDVCEPSDCVAGDDLMVRVVHSGGLEIEYVLFEEFVLSAGAGLLCSDDDFVVF
jgi:hypothetical protein